MAISLLVAVVLTIAVRMRRLVTSGKPERPEQPEPQVGEYAPTA